MKELNEAQHLELIEQRCRLDAIAPTSWLDNTEIRFSDFDFRISIFDFRLL